MAGETPANPATLATKLEDRPALSGGQRRRFLMIN